ncbi:hypothetical protein DL95DRAFT_416677, partial [Leptodontidium sp. 2 PMI_412]
MKESTRLFLACFRIDKYCSFVVAMSSLLKSQQDTTHIPELGYESLSMSNHHRSKFPATRTFAYLQHTLVVTRTTMAPLTLCTREIEKEMVQLQLRLKAISSRPEVAEISRYMSSLGVATEDYIKNEAMRSFIDSKSDAESLWREIDIFRMTDETSKFFIDDANVDLPTLCELQGAVQIWSHLVVAGGLDMVLARYPDIVMVKRRGGSPAEVFREYLSAHQLEGDFEIWDETRMNVFRLKLFELDQDLRLTKREDLSL